MDADAERDVDLTRLEDRRESATGEQILVRGVVESADSEVLSGAVVDIQQANHGRYSHPRRTNEAPLDPHFQGWGITKTSQAGAYAGFPDPIETGAYCLSFLIPAAPAGAAGLFTTRSIQRLQDADHADVFRRRPADRPGSRNRQGARGRGTVDCFRNA